jgi:hypothetical protein
VTPSLLSLPSGVFKRVMVCLFVSGLIAGFVPVTGDDPEAERLIADLRCDSSAAPFVAVDHGRVIEEVRHAHAWNRLLLNSPLATQERGGYFSVEAVLATVDDWSPLFACIAREFGIPPELLAGLLAVELDLDYHFTDAAVDTTIRMRTLAGHSLCRVAIGGGYGGVHTSHLKPALATLGQNFSASPFYQTYYHLITSRDSPAVTWLTTNYLAVDLANAAVMAHYYARLRLGRRPMASLTLTDMAFVWSAYRGGVVGTPADPDAGSRWSLDALQKADNPYIFGDTIIALPYFSHYRAVYRSLYPN